MKYTVEFKYHAAGATSTIDNITAPIGYTAEQYVADCKLNADDAWNAMLQNGTVTLTPHEYYIITEGRVADEIYGEWNPICLSEDEVRRLSVEYETDLFQVLHEASADEIATYGVYD